MYSQSGNEQLLFYQNVSSFPKKYVCKNIVELDINVEIHKTFKEKFLRLSYLWETFKNQIHIENRYFIIFIVVNINH